MKPKIIASSGDGRYIMEVEPSRGQVVYVKDEKAHLVTRVKPIGSLTKMGYWNEVSPREAQNVLALVDKVEQFA